MADRFKSFLASKAFGVVGASKDRNKFGNKVLRCYQQHNMTVYAVNPTETEIEGAVCYSKVSELPADVKSISIITPPQRTERIVQEAIKHGIENIWMQPGAESAAAIEQCQKHGINVIGDGSCILVVLGFNG
jgi:predicted CoA-binding protein